jgi:hypothetical protein
MGCQIGFLGIMQARMTANHARLLALVSAIFAAAILRLVPHPPNFTPIGAMALFSGAYLGRRWTAFAAPFGGLIPAMRSSVSIPECPTSTPASR